MTELLQFSLCLLAFNCFALAKFNHYRDVFKARPSQKQSQQFLIAAWISILLSLLLCVIKHQGYGGLLFCGYMALSVLLLMIFYSFKPSWVKHMSVLNVVLLLLSGSYFVVY
ncbi:MAG: DUF3325 domain-containing protein [Pseudoalteromonas sp.]|uniref:DUF3325 domain-containing protein n=1 Tax=unclassified Pseudoalteromonas TaxID=194690 RepID=UPI000C07AF59|nr:MULTISPECIES: DUF3325 domain-containing protein [unclassified Pseudoalteromonas]MDP2635648.1 DUF3325 domain-containing protein [Pseudoalteromonas sp. 1_MG-2023]PHN91646.1 hypothetical protein CSC79_00985 [Pseudoalteromonas sp. 3D05]TGE84723.1 DUF3325 domain-containing protein [Pseudoalteromonas sp. KS88]